MNTSPKTCREWKWFRGTKKRGHRIKTQCKTQSEVHIKITQELTARQEHRKIGKTHVILLLALLLLLHNTTSYTLCDILCSNWINLNRNELGTLKNMHFGYNAAAIPPLRDLSGTQLTSPFGPLLAQQLFSVYSHLHFRVVKQIPTHGSSPCHPLWPSTHSPLKPAQCHMALWEEWRRLQWEKYPIKAIKTVLAASSKCPKLKWLTMFNSLNGLLNHFEELELWNYCTTARHDICPCAHLSVMSEAWPLGILEMWFSQSCQLLSMYDGRSIAGRQCSELQCNLGISSGEE